MPAAAEDMLPWRRAGGEFGCLPRMAPHLNAITLAPVGPPARLRESNCNSLAGSAYPLPSIGNNTLCSA